MESFTSSVIVRVKNEASDMRKLCALLQSQTTQDFEVVVVNDHSSDGSDKVAGEYFSAERARVVNLQRSFNYAYASNLGAEIAKGKFLVYLSAHSFPVSRILAGARTASFCEYESGRSVCFAFGAQKHKLGGKIIYQHSNISFSF